MEGISVNEWIGIVYHYLTKEKFSKEELAENLQQKIEQAIEDKSVPISFRTQVANGVDRKFKEFKYPIWQVSKKTDNPNIKYCEIQKTDRHNYIDSYTNSLRLLKKDEKYIGSLVDHSQEIIQKFPNPKESSENYNHKGLVIGQIQSGKTANIEALVCRAIDFGYRFIVIMCGRTKALRKQTQFRFDTEILNDTDSWSKLTTVDNDFKGGTIDIDSNIEKPKIAIIKKIPSILEKVRQKIEKIPELKDHPCLIIDDECDDASIDTNANKEDIDHPTRTNQEIRNLINSFNKIVYVGFSATPFANVFIDADNAEDLYPSDFIFLLDTPKGYTGTRDFIGEYENNFITTLFNDQNEIQKEELKKSIYSFILSCFIIKEKGIDLPRNNFSMLIHPSYKKDIHSIYEKEVKEIVEGLKHYLEHPKYSNVKEELENLYKEQFSFSTISFQKIFKHYGYFMSKIEIKKLNSERPDEEDTDKHILKYQEKDKVYIVIGGNILARGLTLEGLLTSFFTRESKGKHQYDSLLQMQRWCGFRKDYLKYTKIYTTKRLKNDLIDLVDIETEFREQIKELFNEEGASPSIVKPRIRKSQQMRIVSKVKKGRSFEDIYKEGRDLKTLEFYSDSDKLKDNIHYIKQWSKGQNWIKDQSDYTLRTSVENILLLIESYNFYNENHKKRIQIQIEHFANKYKEWKVKIHNPTEITDDDDFSYSEELKVKKIRRGFKKIGNSLKISTLKHRLKETDIPQLIIYIINERSNKLEYTGKSRDIDETLEAPKPIVALYFQFPDQGSTSKGTYQGQ